MKRYRLKTKEEFEKEFGLGWRWDVQFGWNKEMDRFFGTALSEEEIKAFSKNHSFERGRYMFSTDMVKDLASEIEIKIDKQGRETIAEITYNGKVYRGIAKRDPKDEDNPAIGVALATIRAAWQITNYTGNYLDGMVLHK